MIYNIIRVMTMTSTLENFGLLKISGAQGLKFLQGQLTCDLEKITPGHFSLAAHCNPQGRVISLFYIFNYNENYYLFMQRSMVAVTLAALKKYAIFFKIELTDASAELITDSNISRLAHLCYEQIISFAIPHIYPETSGLFLPHELNLQDLKAIDFDKGCYTGQEIIARMHYRGKVKNRLYRYKLSQDILPAPGDDIYSRDDLRACGSVVDLRKENDDFYAFVIMNEANFQDQRFNLKDNITINMQLISNTSSEK